MHLIVCSLKDLASVNIRDCLLSILNAEERVLGEFKLYDAGDIGVLEVERDLLYLDNLDERLRSLGLEFQDVLFASRHSSKDKRKIFTVHVSGNVERADYGGKPYSLAKPAPFVIKNYVLSIVKRIDRKPEFTFTLEATHHGPSEISTPSAFFEIGSTEEEWRDREAAEIVAESLVEALRSERRDWEVAVGVGGTHYVPRQTEIILETTFTFGHNFAKYTFNGLNVEILRKAVDLSDARYIVIDEKSVNSRVKGLVREVSDLTGVEVLKSKEVKKRFRLRETD